MGATHIILGPEGSTGGGGGGDVDRQFRSSTINNIGLSVKAIAGQVAQLFGVYASDDTLLAGFEVDGDLFAPNVISRTGEAGEFTLNDFYDNFDFTGPANGDVLTYNSVSGKYENLAPSGGGGGDVTGPGSSNDNAIARFDGTTGKIIQDYTSNAPTINDSGVPDFRDLTRANSQRIGLNSSVTGNNSTSIGVGARTALNGVAIGTLADVESERGVAIGVLSDIPSGSSFSVAIGYDSTTSGNSATALGYLTRASQNATAIGNEAEANGTNSIAIGKDAVAAGQNAVLVGTGSATQTNNVAMGVNVNVTAQNAFAIGTNLTTAFEQTFLIGSNATATEVGQFIVGGSNSYFSQFYIGSSPAGLSSTTLSGRGGTQVHFPSVVAGEANGSAVGAIFKPGQGTGTGDGGYFLFQVAPGGSAGSTRNPYVDAFKINPDGESLFKRAISKPITTVAANTTLDTSHYTVLVNASSGPVTITLPPVSLGREYRIKKIDSSSNTVTITGSQNIDGQPSQIIASQYGSRILQATSVEWFVI